MKYFLKSIAINYFKYKGRAGRAEFLAFITGYFVLEILCFVIAFAGFLTLGSYLSTGLELFIIIPSLSITVRRLHDCNFSGMWLSIPVLLSAVAIGIFCVCFLNYTEITDEEINNIILGGDINFIPYSADIAIKILTVIAALFFVFIGVITLFLKGSVGANRFGRLSAF